MQKFDTDNNGCVTFSEFCAGVQNMSNDNVLTLFAKPIDVGSQEGDECNSRVSQSLCLKLFSYLTEMQVIQSNVVM